jgi:hypothetical protein
MIVFDLSNHFADPESNNGLRLICQSEFNTNTPHRDVLAISQKLDAAVDPNTMDTQTSGVASCLIIGECENYGYSASG